MYLRKICSILTIMTLLAGIWFYCCGTPWSLFWLERETKQHLAAEGYEQEQIVELEAYYDRSTQYKYFSRVTLREQDEDRIYCYDVTGKLQRIE